MTTENSVIADSLCRIHFTHIYQVNVSVRNTKTRDQQVNISCLNRIQRRVSYSIVYLIQSRS